MDDEYDEHAKKYFKTKDEFKLERIRNYFSPIRAYFTLKKKYEELDNADESKKELKKRISSIEKTCNENIEKIVKVLKK